MDPQRPASRRRPRHATGMRLELQVNGRPVVREIEPQELLLDMLRNRLALTGAKRSCETQVCGTCTVLVDGRPVSSCCFLAADAEGREVLTVEGLTERPDFARLEDAFTRHAALQCGFCTPGMLLTVVALLETGELTSAEEIKRALSGNLCRCTGYKGIVEAVCDLAGVA
jgi:aerobic-type carbon monoxide dehydrogenase small subunit (CoxS/CutS family)